MKQKISLVALVVILAISFYSCNKNSQDNAGSSTSSELSLKVQALNKSFALPFSGFGTKSASVTNATMVWETATMIVSKVNFEAEMKSVLTGRDSLTIQYTWRGPKTIDLFDLSSTIGSIVLPAGTYEKISLSLKSEREDANGQPLVYLSGKYTNDTIVVPIIVSVSDPVSFKTEQKGDTIVAGGTNDLSGTIQIYLDQLMAQVDVTAFSKATLTNGKVVISATSNKDLYRMILQYIRKDHSCKFERHHHGD